MALMSRKVDYALLILSHLHRHPEGAPAREIAATFELSRPFVANILKLLCHKGFVASHRGVKGGYVMCRDAEQIRFSDLLDALDDSFRLAECNEMSPQHSCTLTAICPLKNAVADLYQRLREVLRTVTLADLFKTSCGSSGQSAPLNISIPNWSIDRQLAVN